MNNCTSSKIMETIDIKPSFRMPSPVGNNRINKTSNHNTIKQISIKVASFRKGAGDQCGSGGSKNKLEKPLWKFVICKKKEYAKSCKNVQNHCPSNFKFWWKSWGTVFSWILFEIKPPLIQTLPAISWKKKYVVPIKRPWSVPNVNPNPKAQ